MFKLREIVKTYGLATGISAAVNLLLVMILALSNPQHQIIFDFNQYGEHYTEIVMFLIGVPCLIYMGYSMLKVR